MVNMFGLTTYGQNHRMNQGFLGAWVSWYPQPTWIDTDHWTNDPYPLPFRPSSGNHPHSRLLVPCGWEFRHLTCCGTHPSNVGSNFWLCLKESFHSFLPFWWQLIPVATGPDKPQFAILFPLSTSMGLSKISHGISDDFTNHAHGNHQL